MRKTLAKALVIAFAIAGIELISTPAMAAQNCPTGAICFYDTSVSASPFHQRDWADSYIGECFSISPYTSWVRNQNSKTWRVYQDSTCSTFPQSTIYANTTGAMNSDWNNKIRSYKRIS